ncbi:hypothetical protein LEP1GSC145_2058 [Leptospira interrogans serovar Djasiman str. LT1649]|nr:hypothetical protein LEP1GSC148_3750 [Leptospira interrogans serovar Canicola str. LT1962]EMJ55523.1 hypothetical protein LEP1GSC013_3639 [Leptospira interrogans serovar Valbuzzi str. Duyster]EMM90010.1 hypothetical protein LEP1GSC145_2058 [Leptospira interrogans serovar Djasiman str. LT1649]ENO71785.1 hypothetical protein LEP1GSC012_3480 [Leptospira interrogans serovar Valbuzzi str. Valbuzzi]
MITRFLFGFEIKFYSFKFLSFLRFVSKLNFFIKVLSQKDLFQALDRFL